MKKSILPLVSSLLFCTAAHADAQKEPTSLKCFDYRMNFYAKAFGGANFVENTTINGNKATYEAGYVAAGSLGYSWNPYGLRVEFEYAYRRNAISKIHFISQGSSTHGHLMTSSYMANLLWDFPLCKWGVKFWNIQPFIGAGIGGDVIRMHASNSLVDFHQKWNKFAWQAIGGFAYPIFRNTMLSLEYQFHQGGGHFYNQSVGIGLMYKFGYIK